MRRPIFCDRSRSFAEAYCEHSHGDYQGTYGKNTQRHFRKPPALLAGACLAHMRWLCARR
jgi:hypothetical protein